MDFENLRREFDEIKVGFRAPAPTIEDRLRDLFRVFKTSEETLADLLRASKGPEDDRRSDCIVEMQSIIIEKAAALPADSPAGVLFKLAMWRWDCAEIDARNADLTRQEAIAFSAFLDLARILDAEFVLKASDLISLQSATPKTLDAEEEIHAAPIAARQSGESDESPERTVRRTATA